MGFNVCVKCRGLRFHVKNVFLFISVYYIYRKPTNSNITIHQNSNHLQDRKDAAYRYYANRMKELPNTKQAVSLERIHITEIASKMVTLSNTSTI